MSGAEGAPLSVLTTVENQPEGMARPRWTRQQKRIYQRANTMLARWESLGMMVRWVMLSSSSLSDPNALALNHARLLRRIECEFGYGAVEYIVIQTAEGDRVPVANRGVLHVLWAWKVPPGWRRKHFYVPQAWLSDTWLSLHGASYVWIAPYKPGHRSRGRVSRYLVTQYCAGQDALVRFFWSWRRSFGVSITKLWPLFVRVYSRRGMAGILSRWHALIAGGTVEAPDHGRQRGRWVFNLDAQSKMKSIYPVDRQMVLDRV